MTAQTISDVFIIESLALEDEDSFNRREGLRLAELLRLSGKNPKYFYITSPNELPHILKLFKLSRYRYLHFSCHASDSHIATTEEEITYAKFAKICKNYFKLRRVFFSACSLGNEQFIRILSAQNKGMQSVVAPAGPIDFDYSAAIWSAFYVSLFNKNMRAMNGNEIKKTFQILCQLFPVDFYFAKYRSERSVGEEDWEYFTIQKNTGDIV